MNPLTVCFCHPILSMISARGAPFLRWSMATTWAVLLPSRGAVASCVWAALLPWGAFLAAVALLVALPFVTAPLADCAPPLALRSAFGCRGCAGFGFTDSPRSWMLFQIRVAAVVRSLNFLTGVTPGRLFQMATSRSAGQPAASSASSFWLAKESNGVAAVATASSGVPCAVMLLSVSIVKVVIIGFLSTALNAVMTWITRFGPKGKSFVQICSVIRRRRRTGDEECR